MLCFYEDMKSSYAGCSSQVKRPWLCVYDGAIVGFLGPYPFAFKTLQGQNAHVHLNMSHYLSDVESQRGGDRGVRLERS